MRLGFRAHLLENHWASMPHEFLHAETHQHLLDHGYQLAQSHPRVGGQYAEHHYTHPEGSGPADINWEDGDEENFEPPEHASYRMAGGLKQHGWKHSPIDSHEFHQKNREHYSSVYNHPNGSRLQVREDNDYNSGSIKHHVILRYPMANKVNESVDPNASMRHDFLHAETHQHLTGLGFHYAGTLDTPHYTSHFYEHPERQTYDGTEDEHPSHDVNLSQHGWKFDPMGSKGHDAVANDDNIQNGQYTHPNGARLHYTERTNSDEGYTLHSAEMRFPK